MSVISVIGVMLAALGCVVLFCFGATWLEKQKHGDFYDERQLVVRGRAYELAFKVSEFCFLPMIALFVYQVDGEKIVEPYLAVIACFAIKSLVFHTYCMMNHAALPVSQKPFINFVGFLVMGALTLWGFFRYVEDCPLPLVGYGSWGVAQLLFAVYLFYVALMYLLQVPRREKE